MTETGCPCRVRQRDGVSDALSGMIVGRAETARNRASRSARGSSVRSHRRGECAAGDGGRLGNGENSARRPLRARQSFATSSRWLTLTSAPIRPLGARIADLVLASAPASACLARRDIPPAPWHGGWRCTSCSALTVISVAIFLYEQAELGRARRRVRPQEAEALRLGPRRRRKTGDPNRVPTVGCDLEFQGGVKPTR